VSGAYVASAALATAYGGDQARARELLDRARAANARTGCVSHLAFESYVDGELLATTRPRDAVPYYLDAIEGARRAGSRFIEGVATVSLASARTRIGDVAGAAEGFAYLIDYWRRTGQPTQLWTTARNAAGLLSQVGHQETAAMLLICADDAPEAAAVGPQIARHSGRAFTPIGDLVDVIALAQLRAEAGRLGPNGVLDRAAAELRGLVG
jgi:hypothetical protein